MKIDIDIDESRIDYEKINAQIIERINNMTDEDIIKLSPHIHSAAFDLCKSKLEPRIDYYIKNNLQWLDENGYLTDKCREYIRNLINTYIMDNMKEQLDEYLKCIDDESLKEAIKNITPSILVSVIENFLTNKMVTTFDNMRYNAFEDAKGAIRYSFKANGMPVSTPVDNTYLPTSDY